MSKRKSVGLANLSFNRIDPYGMGETTSPTPSAEPSHFHIDMIMPDPDQPRRLLPTTLSQRLQMGEVSPSQAIQEWETLVQTNQASPAVSKAWHDITRLADSIAHQGLINPITIRLAPPEKSSMGIKYLIITGERRWWAHVLLTAQDRPIREGHEEVAPDRIKASLAAEGTPVRAHQMIENLIREDIGVIEKANGIYALRGELEKLFPEKSVTWQDVETALGMSRMHRNRILKVLSLNDEAQNLVAQCNLTERAIRPIIERLATSPELQLIALHQLIAWQGGSDESMDGQISHHLEQYIDQILSQKRNSSTLLTGRIVPRPDRTQRLHQKVRQTLKIAGRFKGKEIADLAQVIQQDEQYADVVADLQTLRDFLNQLLSKH